MKWSKQELEVLRNNTDKTAAQLSELLPDRTINAINLKRQQLGLRSTVDMPWQDWEFELLANNEFLSNIEISKSVLPHRSYEAVKTARNKAGLAHMVRCNRCGIKIKKNNQHDICTSCKKTHNDYNKSFTHKYSQYKHGANRRGYSFDITLEQFAVLYNGTCSYCGSDVGGAGIDRVDNTIGYTMDNIVVCCEKCNRLKMALDFEDWVSHMKKIIAHLEARQ